jgi:hypothetical protein
VNLSTAILGKSAVDRLTAAASSVLVIGKDQLTRADLAQVGCYNFTAARILSAVLHDELQVDSLRQVYDQIDPQALALPRLGVISLAVLGAAFEARGIGGSNPLESYVRKHAAARANGAGGKAQARELTTFDTFKRQARAREQAARPKGRRRR